MLVRVFRELDILYPQHHVMLWYAVRYWHILKLLLNVAFGTVQLLFVFVAKAKVHDLLHDRTISGWGPSAA